MFDAKGEELERLGRRLSQIESRLGEVISRLQNVEEHIFDPHETGETIHDEIAELQSRVNDLESGWPSDEHFEDSVPEEMDPLPDMEDEPLDP